MANERRTVWVLGSGFSKSLGGPLLKDLIGERACEETREIFRTLGERPLVYKLFNKLKGTHWEHAEEFLDYLDTAVSPDSYRNNLIDLRIHELIDRNWNAQIPSVKALRDEAVLTVAAECSTYTHGVDMRNPPEAWHPYKHWASKRGMKIPRSSGQLDYATLR